MLRFWVIEPVIAFKQCSHSFVQFKGRFRTSTPPRPGSRGRQPNPTTATSTRTTSASSPTAASPSGSLWSSPCSLLSSISRPSPRTTSSSPTLGRCRAGSTVGMAEGMLGTLLVTAFSSVYRSSLGRVLLLRPRGGSHGRQHRPLRPHLPHCQRIQRMLDREVRNLGQCPFLHPLTTPISGGKSNAGPRGGSAGS